MEKKRPQKKKLDKIIKKYGLNPDDLEENRAIYELPISFKTKDEKVLIIQIAIFTTQNTDLMGYETTKRNVTFTCLTKDQCAQIAVYIDTILPIYRQSKNNMAKRHKKEREHLSIAFVAKNKLFGPINHNTKSTKKRTSLDLFTLADIDKDLEEIDHTPQLPFNQ